MRDAPGRTEMAARARRSALETIVSDPDLAPLWRRLGRNAVDHRFFGACFRSEASYGRRRLLMRMALGDSRSGATNRSLRLRLTPTLLSRIVTFLESHPGKPLDPFASRFGHDVPTHLRALFGGSAMGNAAFVHRAIVRPFVRAMVDQAPFPRVSNDVTAKDARRILAPVAQRVILSRPDAERFLDKRRVKTTRTTGRFFFATGSPTLDIRNVLQFAEVLFAKTGHGGRLQSRLPTALLARIGSGVDERHVSIPDLLLATDLLSLAALGLLRTPLARRRGPLEESIHALSGESLLAFPKDLRALARRHFQRTLLDRSSSAALSMAQDRGRWERMYGSGLLFNLERLASEDAAGRRFARFVPLYRCVDGTGLQREILRHFRRVDPAFGEALEKSMCAEPEEFAEIRGRSLANALFHARWLASVGEKPGVRLPSVAMYRLGLPEPVYSGARSGKQLRRRRRRGYARTQRPVLTLPLLERLSKHAPILDV